MKQLWVGAAVDYAMEHGLSSLSLRPLAAALGTSDRMLIYHFKSKDDLLATILKASNTRSVAIVESAVPPSDIADAVVQLWQLMLSTTAGRCYGLYIEASAMGLLMREPFRTSVAESNRQWSEGLAHYFQRAGVPEVAGERVVTLVDAAFMGFLLDMPLDDHASGRNKAVEDLAASVAIIASGTSPGCTLRSVVR